MAVVVVIAVIVVIVGIVVIVVVVVFIVIVVIIVVIVVVSPPPRLPGTIWLGPPWRLGSHSKAHVALGGCGLLDCAGAVSRVDRPAAVANCLPPIASHALHVRGGVLKYFCFCPPPLAHGGKN